MSSDSPASLSLSDPHWGAEGREQKAQNILQCLDLLTNLDLEKLNCVDIGCGSGGISFHLAPAFREVCGIDPEPWQRWDDFMAERPNLSFREGSIESLRITDGSVDVVICNQVYEHVPDPQQLIAQIYRILKPGGMCYFAGPNLLYPIEPHVHWPFIHWIPRKLALHILGIFSPAKVGILDAYSTTYWTLQRWLREFDITDAVPDLIQFRARSQGGIWRVFRGLPKGVMQALGFLSPGFIFLLEKPDDARNKKG